MVEIVYDIENPPEGVEPQVGDVIVATKVRQKAILGFRADPFEAAQSDRDALRDSLEMHGILTAGSRIKGTVLSDNPYTYETVVELTIIDFTQEYLLAKSGWVVIGVAIGAVIVFVTLGFVVRDFVELRRLDLGGDPDAGKNTTQVAFVSVVLIVAFLLLLKGT